MAGGDVLDGVGLVENDHVIFGQVIHAGNPQRQIGEEQGVIDDKDIARAHPPLGRLPETVLVEFAFLAEAVAVFGTNAFPHGRIGLRRQIGQ